MSSVSMIGGHADLLAVAEDARRAAHRALRLPIAVLQQHAARRGVEEVLHDIHPGRDRPHAPREAEAPLVPREHDKLGFARLGLLDAGEIRDACPDLVRRQRRIGRDVDPVVQVAEDREHHALAVQLPADIGAEHAHAAVILVGALDDVAGEQGVVADLADPQLARAQHRLRPRVPVAQRLGGAGHDRGEAPAVLGCWRRTGEKSKGGGEAGERRAVPCG